MNKQLAFSVLHHLQKMGISIALDDFGTGYSSLSMLRDFHFDVIKLDRSFMLDVESNPQVRSFVRAIIFAGQLDQYAAYRRGRGNRRTTADPRRGGM
ncbi:sensory box/GGDEF family protein [Klebsiella quasipneumoniae]|nr:sensory box/GGDEF family protein [Klebsiella quasipneumoniae]